MNGKDPEMLAAMKELVIEIRLLRKAIENARPPSSIVVNRVVDRDAYPPVTPPPLGFGLPPGLPHPGPPGPLGPLGCPPAPVGSDLKADLDRAIEKTRRDEKR